MTTERIGPRTGADTGGDGVAHDGTAHDGTVHNGTAHDGVVHNGTVHDGTADGGGSEPPRGERNGPADGAGAGSGGRQDGGRQDGGRDGSPGAGGTPGAGGGPPGDGQGPRRHSSWKHPSNRRRWFILFVVILLIGVPAGYIVISAGQSRDSGRDKQARASAQGLTAEWPPRVTRRIYEVPITGYSDDVAFYESNSWNTSKLYVQFTTSENGLNLFLGRIGTGPGELDKGRVTITAEEAAEVGWHLGAGQPSASSRALSTVPTDKEDWSGLVLDHPGPRPRLKVTVDRSNPAHPMVYVVSTVKL